MAEIGSYEARTRESAARMAADAKLALDLAKRTGAESRSGERIA
jgi:hypothetical protein